MLNAKWLKQILSGDKKLLKAKEARHCNPPRYDEISVANLYNTCIVMEGSDPWYLNSRGASGIGVVSSR